MAIMQKDLYKPGKTVSYLKQTSFFRTFGPRKAALVSGLFTTFEGTRFSGVELFEHNPAGLLKIISTTKYDEVKAAAVGKLGENSIDQLKGLANNTRSVPVRNIALVRLIIIGEFDFIAEHHGKCAGEQPVVDVLGNHVDKITNQNLLRILGDKHKDQSIRKAALEKITDRSILSNICMCWNNSDGEVDMALARLPQDDIIKAFDGATSENKIRIARKLGISSDGLEDQKALKIIVGWHPEENAVKAAASKIVDLDVILEMAKKWPNRFGCLDLVIPRLTPSQMAEVYYATTHQEVKEIVLGKLAAEVAELSDPCALHVLCNHDDPPTRLMAANRLGDEEKLVLVAATGHLDVAAVAVKKLPSLRLWEANKSATADDNKNQITSRLFELIGEISDEEILAYLVARAWEQRRSEPMSARPNIYNLAEAMSKKDHGSLSEIGLRLSNIIDHLDNKELVILAAAFANNDPTILAKAIDKLKDDPNMVSIIAILSALESARDRALELIKDHENALALVGRQKGALADTDQKAIDTLGVMAERLKITDSLRLVGMRGTNRLARHNACYRITVLCYDMGQRLVRASYEGYDVRAALGSGLTNMRIYERLLLDIKVNTIYPDTREYASTLQNSLVNDWNEAARQSGLNMFARELERTAENIRRSFGGGGASSNAFRSLHMPGDEIVDAVDKVFDRIF